MSDNPTGWIAFETAAFKRDRNDKTKPDMDSHTWLVTNNTENITAADWDYEPETRHFAKIRSIDTNVVRDYAGINSSGGPQVAGRADHSEMLIVRDVDWLTPILFQFVSTGEAFNRVMIVLPDYSTSTRVEWRLTGVNLTHHEFICGRGKSPNLEYETGGKQFQEATKIETSSMGTYYFRREKVKLLYTSANMRVATGENMDKEPDFHGWDTGTNRIPNHPT